MKRLLIMAKSLGGGGTEVALIEFLNSLDFKKFDVTLLLLNEDNEYKYRLNKNIKIRYLNFDKDFYKNMVSMYTITSKVIKKMHFNRMLKIYDNIIQHSTKITEKYDIALDFYGYGSFTTEYIARAVNADFKATWIHDEKMNWLYNVDSVLKDYNKFFCVSKAVKDEFDKLFPLFKKKSMVFYNVINNQKIIDAAERETNLPYNMQKINILTVGRLTEQKGIDIAVRAAHLLKKQNISFKWFVIGEGRDHKKLLKLIRQKNVEDCFFLLGRKDNPYPYMKNCTLYVQPSRHEGFGLTLFEARLLKRPVIATNLPAFQEQIIDRKNGLLVDQNNYYSLAKKIRFVLEDQNFMDKIKSYIDSENIKYDNNLVNTLFT